jgi:hypothetical protein
MIPFVPGLMAGTNNKANIASFYIYIHSLFTNAVNNSHYMVSSKLMMVNKELESVWKESATAKIKVLQK